MSDIRLVVPSGAFGPSLSDSLLDVVLRGIAVAASTDPKGEWAEKYGTDFDNDEFMMHRFCWCEQDDCPWCTENSGGALAPNFWHKSSGFKVWWYKYIGRSVETYGTPPADLMARCIASIDGVAQ